MSYFSYQYTVVWIALEDLDEDHVYVWTYTQEVLNVSQNVWASGQPDFCCNSPLCIILNGWHAWDDWICTDPWYPLCEYLEE